MSVEFQSGFDELMKARRASVGEIRRYGKFDYHKTPYGWVYVGENKLYQINEQFNKILDKQIKGELSNKYVYELGKPENILLSAGFPNKKIQIAAQTLSLKSSKKYKNNHPFDLKDVRNLPFALNHPIFIFNSKTQPTSKVVITDLKSNNVNLLIALQIDFKEKDAIVISIRSIYPKESQQSILNWVNEGLLVWRDKKKALKFSSKLQSNSADVRENTSALFDTVNIIRKFENANKKDNELNIIKDKLRKAVSEETALEKEVIDSHSLSIQRKKDAPLVAYSSPSFSLPKDTTNTNDMQQFMDEIIEKSKKGAPIGTERTYSNGKTYVKTENGWKPKSGAKKTKKEDDQTEKTSSKVNDVNSYASKASDEQLQAAINDKDASPEIKQAAQEELSKRNPKKEDDGSDKIIDTLQKLLDAQKKGELKLGEEMLNQIKEKLKTLKQKKSESVTEETLNKKLDKLKEDISSKIDEKLDKLNGFKKITQTYVKVDGQTIVLNMKGEDRYKAKKGKFYMESEPKESLVEFKKRVKEAFENKLKESEKEGVQKQEKVEEKINKPVKKMQVFNSAGQLFFGNTTQALEGGSDVEFTKDNVTFRLSSIDKGNDTIYTLKNQDTGEEISWENSLIRLKSKINELTKDDSSKSTTLHFENVEEFKDYVSKRNSAKGNLTEDQLDRFNKAFKELEQNINSIEEGNLGFVRSNIKDSNYRYLLDVYAKVNPSMKMAMNKELIKSGCSPIANGMLYSEYNGKDYRHFTEENESKLFYKADRNRTNETEKKALDFYKGEGYVGIREFNLGKSENSQFSQMSSIISSFIDKNPLEDNLVLNRRMDVNTISDINALNQWIGANVGDVIEDKSFTSFSLRQLANFGDDLQVTLLAKKGDKISNINNPYETEYLAQKNSKYKVIAKGTNSIVVEIV